jgi:toxin ParE1/3/4
MTFRFHVEAAAEYENQIRYYRRCQPGLQHRFTAAVEEALVRIVENPERWRMIEPDIRRCLVKKFPFSIIYSIQPGIIFVLAIAHSSREPGYWNQRITTD